jgi:dTMP kinase
MDIDWVIEANKFSAEILRPDLNLFIDVPPTESMRRISENRDGAELYENLENLELVRSKYMEAFEKLKSEEKIVSINGVQTKEVIAEAIWNAVTPLL